MKVRTTKPAAIRLLANFIGGATLSDKTNAAMWDLWRGLQKAHDVWVFGDLWVGGSQASLASTIVRRRAACASG